ncbi:MAG TPA: DNA-formamidopyrimidine glycosylase family protein [Bacteroidota bacterium]|nr:DNA-formamidopyrimidine glycosylase family protein [Bacteroidota bacterium]
MPELPDILYITRYLQSNLKGRTITSVAVRQSIVIRDMLKEPPQEALTGRLIGGIDHRGPFLEFVLSGGLLIVLNLMLAGRLQHRKAEEKALGHVCLSMGLDDGSMLILSDEKKMAKLYITRREDAHEVPRYGEQGVDILSESFTRERFKAIAKTNARRQVRVVVNDQTVLSAIGNAYADEVLFEARIHPKTFIGRLSEGELDRLFDAIRSVIIWAAGKVEEAHQPIHIKVRDHLRVRNRKGERCPRCGTTIRREGVRGHDVFFCPSCQPASRKLFINWNDSPSRTRGSSPEDKA